MMITDEAAPMLMSEGIYFIFAIYRPIGKSHISRLRLLPCLFWFGHTLHATGEPAIITGGPQSYLVRSNY